MGLTELRDRVAVLAKFEFGKLFPVVIRWQGRRYWVQRVNLHHMQREGTDHLHYYAVSTEVGDCTLAYSQQNLTWTLTEVNFNG